MNTLSFTFSGLLRYALLFAHQLMLRLRYPARLRFRSFLAGISFTSSLRPIGRRARIRLGSWFYLHRNSDMECHDGEISIGDRVFINKNCTIVARERIVIGNDCMFGEDLSMYDHDHLFALNGTPFRDQGFVTKPISIGNNVWVGCKVYIGKGVTIGNNVVIGAGSIVTKDIPANSLYIGTVSRPLAQTASGQDSR